MHIIGDVTTGVSEIDGAQFFDIDANLSDQQILDRLPRAQALDYLHSFLPKEIAFLSSSVERMQNSFSHFDQYRLSKTQEDLSRYVAARDYLTMKFEKKQEIGNLKSNVNLSLLGDCNVNKNNVCFPRTLF